MMQIILPLLMIASSIGLYFGYIDPTYKGTSALTEKNREYETALDNANQLTKKIDELVSKRNSLPADEVDRMGKLLPDYVDSVRLIMEIDRIALKYGMSLREVRVEGLDKSSVQDTSGVVGMAQKDYDNVKLSFSVLSNYQTFKEFISEMESNLRVSDITKISFSAQQGTKVPDVYQFSVILKTYWLK